VCQEKGKIGNECERSLKTDTSKEKKRTARERARKPEQKKCRKTTMHLRREGDRERERDIGTKKQALSFS